MRPAIALRSNLSPTAKSMILSAVAEVAPVSPTLNTNVSLPAPPLKVSAPLPPSMVSAPPPPRMVSALWLPTTWSAASPPVTFRESVKPTSEASMSKVADCNPVAEISTVLANAEEAEAPNVIL